jgi:hypothetical protein
MLRDSSNKPLNIPFIDICKYPTCSVEPITFEGGKDSLLMHLKYANTGAPATHININIIMCFRANNQLFLIEGHRLNISDKQLNTGEFTTINANTITTNGEIIEKIYICISGTCRNSDGKEFPIFLLNEYDFKEKKYIGGLLSDDYKEVASFLKNNQKL